MKMILSWVLAAGLAWGNPGERVANTTLNLPGDPPNDAGYRLVNAFGSLTFSNPIATANAPGDTDHVYVVERAGRLIQVDLATNTKSTFVNLASYVSSQGWSLQSGCENGFLSAAFHPDYQTNGWIFVFYSVNIGGRLHQRIARITTNGSGSVTSHVSLITQKDEACNHNGGTVAFGPDGYLYVSFGDEGGGGDEYDNGNHIDRDFFSAILRLDVDEKPGSLAPNTHDNGLYDDPDDMVVPVSSAVGSGYRIPPDNPFVGATSHQGSAVDPDEVRTEIWVAGLRNPFRFSFDAANGRCFVADVGQSAREEINIVTGGDDCGWSRREGDIAYRFGPAGTNVPAGFEPLEPIHAYGRSVGRSITGGFVYRGSELPEFQGVYLFADWGSSQIFTLTETPSGWVRQSLLGQSRVAGIGPDPANGDPLFCILNSSSTVRRLERIGEQTPAPSLLSGTGAFSTLSPLTPEDGIYGYDINHPFWSDHARKTRWFSIPDTNDTMNFSGSNSWNFPSGQVWIKHFELEAERGNPATARPIETRFLVKTAQGAYGLSYRWREDGSDADLVPADGETADYTVTENGSSGTQTWIYPSRASCLTCHTADTNFALSFHTRQLNRDGQIDWLANENFLNVSSVPPAPALPSHPAIDDASASRESRVRAYLDVNCAMCHQGALSNVRANFDARIQTPTDFAAIINGPVWSGGSEDGFVVPGMLDHSIVLDRLDGTGNRMPPLASNVLDQQAIQLIEDWITQDLPQRQTYAEFAAGLGSQSAPYQDADGDGLLNELEFLSGTDPAEPTSAFRLSLTSDEVSFMAPANRRVVIERSTDLIDWEALGVVNFPQNAEMTEFALPDLPDLFLRARFEGP